MNALTVRHKLVLIILFSMLLSCSGGESGTGYQQGQTTVGEVTGFGSIYVNGTHYQTTTAEVKIDGVTSDESNLAVGMVVKVVGTVNADRTEGTASQIFMSTGVEGLVFENNYLVDGTINVMGQVINITNDTHFNSDVAAITAFEQIVANDTVVEVHGFTGGQGEFFATMINVVESGGTASEVKIRGVIQGSTGTTPGSTFMLGGITVQFDDMTNLEGGLQMTDLVNGRYVAVESTSFSGGMAQVLATKIEPADQNEAEGTNYELEGIVTDITNIGSNEFTLNGQRIVFDMTTQFQGGTSTDIQLDIELEVEGVVQSDGSILAHQISFHMESDMEVEGTVTNIGSNTLTIDDSVIPVSVTVNEFTSYEDDVDELNHTFHFSQITLGMQLRVKYFVNSDMVNIATSVKRTN